MKAIMKSGRFITEDKIYTKGDIISDINLIPKCFRDQWELIPPKRKKRTSKPKKETTILKKEGERKTTKEDL